MLNLITRLIDRITMYKLLLYYLICLLGTAFVLSLFHHLGYRPLYILISGVLLPTACWVINKIFAWFFNAPTGSDSSLITGLILALIVTPDPTTSFYGLYFMLAAAGLAIASKYVLTINRKHIFNPAAIAVVLTAIGPRQDASWWVGTAVMMPFVVIGGILLAVKIRRVMMISTFFASAIIATAIYSAFGHTSVATSVHSLIFDSAFFFLGFVMLTEPLTSPPTRQAQNIYGARVGVLLPPQVHILRFYSSPELALIVGNVFSYVVSPKTRLFPTLIEQQTIARDSSDFVFEPGTRLNYKPGQYMEFILPHDKTDFRGNRRYFTLASSPTESELRIGVKFYDKGSSFKQAMLHMDKKTPIVADQLAGDFVMPNDTSEKLVFIAGGIGITPFRSMVKYLLDTKERRSIILIYSVRTLKDIAYARVFEEARRDIGITTYYLVTDEKPDSSHPYVMHGFITEQLIKKLVPDYGKRTFYLSGTHPMVTTLKAKLIELGLHRTQVKTDFFPGYSKDL